MINLDILLIVILATSYCAQHKLCKHAAEYPKDMKFVFSLFLNNVFENLKKSLKTAKSDVCQNWSKRFAEGRDIQAARTALARVLLNRLRTGRGWFAATLLIIVSRLFSIAAVRIPQFSWPLIAVAAASVLLSVPFWASSMSGHFCLRSAPSGMPYSGQAFQEHIATELCAGNRVLAVEYTFINSVFTLQQLLKQDSHQFSDVAIWVYFKLLTGKNGALLKVPSARVRQLQKLIFSKNFLKTLGKVSRIDAAKAREAKAHVLACVERIYLITLKRHVFCRIPKFLFSQHAFYEDLFSTLHGAFEAEAPEAPDAPDAPRANLWCGTFHEVMREFFTNLWTIGPTNPFVYPAILASPDVVNSFLRAPASNVPTYLNVPEEEFIDILNPCRKSLKSKSEQFLPSIPSKEFTGFESSFLDSDPSTQDTRSNSENFSSSMGIDPESVQYLENSVFQNINKSSKKKANYTQQTSFEAETPSRVLSPDLFSVSSMSTVEEKIPKTAHTSPHLARSKSAIKINQLGVPKVLISVLKRLRVHPCIPERDSNEIYEVLQKLVAKGDEAAPQKHAENDPLRSEGPPLPEDMIDDSQGLETVDEVMTQDEFSISVSERPKSTLSTQPDLPNTPISGEESSSTGSGEMSARDHSQSDTLLLKRPLLANPSSSSVNHKSASDIILPSESKEKSEIPQIGSLYLEGASPTLIRAVNELGQTVISPLVERSGPLSGPAEYQNPCSTQPNSPQDGSFSKCPGGVGFALLSEKGLLVEKIPELARLNSIEFSAIQVNKQSGGAPLQAVGMYAFEYLGFFETFGFSRFCLARFLSVVESRYLPNPYHNSQHASDVLQFCVLFISRMWDINRDLVSPLEALAVVLATILHDVEHPGFDNNFIVQRQLPLADVYADVSVLENHHASAGWRILEETGLFVKPPRGMVFFEPVDSFAYGFQDSSQARTSGDTLATPEELPSPRHALEATPASSMSRSSSRFSYSALKLSKAFEKWAPPRFIELIYNHMMSGGLDSEEPPLAPLTGDCAFILTLPQLQVLRRVYLSCILATDMSMHFQFIEWIKKFNQTKVGPILEDPARLPPFFLETIIKLADISNPLRAKTVSHVFSLSIMEEFFKMGDIVRLEGGTPAAFHNRNTFQLDIPGCQTAFLNYLIIPFVTSFAQMFGFHEKRFQRAHSQSRRSSSTSMSDTGHPPMQPIDMLLYEMMLNMHKLLKFWKQQHRDIIEAEEAPQLDSTTQ
eukprot:gnl/Chilomastix_cuspidata/1071.p1 GENE.gnl/Chilomastix_cuspidata/1071~~gnl/Chilomastix_cuspidata/1071.p1  ORF type:complete len:1320 (+),score=429.92 gnl/Chilomastix_cuspidata/1071:259-3960(+)